MPHKDQKPWGKIITVVIILLLLLGLGGYFTYSKFIATQNKPEPEQKAEFTFDESAAPGWLASANYWPKPEEFTGDQKQNPEDIQAVGRVISEAESPSDTTVDKCFTMFNYYKQTVDPAAKLEEKKKTMVAHDDTLSLTQTSQETLTMNIFGQQKNYEFYTFETVGSGGTPFMRGNGLGYVAFDGGYVAINTVCPTSADVAKSVPTIKATGLALQQ